MAKENDIEVKIEPFGALPESNPAYTVKWRPLKKGWNPLNWVWIEMTRAIKTVMDEVVYNPMIFEDWDDAKRFAKKIKEDPSEIDRIDKEERKEYKRLKKELEENIRKNNKTIRF